jgi:hypothetical protein
MNVRLYIVTVCMGRLDFVKKTMPENILLENADFIFVDWSCPQHSGDWVEQTYPNVHVVRYPGEKLFSYSKTHNRGAANVPPEQWMMVLDADIVLDRAFDLEIKASCFYVPTPHKVEGIGGTIIVNKADFDLVGGYDEDLTGWGAMDDDLVARLKTRGVQCVEFAPDCLRHMDHDNALRVQYFEEKSMDESHTKNSEIIRGKVLLK